MIKIIRFFFQKFRQRNYLRLINWHYRVLLVKGADLFFLTIRHAKNITMTNWLEKPPFLYSMIRILGLDHLFASQNFYLRRILVCAYIILLYGQISISWDIVQ